MSSADLNNENDFSDRPNRLRSLGDLMRMYGPLSPTAFFNEVRTRVGRHSYGRPDVDRAVFLYRRLRRARLDMRRCLLALAVASVSPFFCFAFPEDVRVMVFGIAIFVELLFGVLLFSRRRQWERRRHDYVTWLRLVYRRASETGGDP